MPFVKFDPAQFRTGQIVQIEVAFNTVPAAGSNYRMVMHLKNVALLDRTMQQVSTIEYIIR